MLPDLSQVCNTIVLAPELTPHSAAIRHDHDLAAGLVRLMAYAFQTATIAMQLPAERLSTQHGDWNWTALQELVAVLASERLDFGIAAHLGADGLRVGRNALQLLLPACQLLNRLPIGDEAGAPAQQAALIGGCWALLRAVCHLLRGGLQIRHEQGSSHWGRQEQQASQLLLQLAARFAPLLHWCEQLTQEEWGEAISNAARSMLDGYCAAVNMLTVLLIIGGLPGCMRSPAAAAAGPFDSPAGLVPWCAAASTWLHSLPALQALTQQQAGQLTEAAAAFVKALLEFSDCVSTGAACIGLNPTDVHSHSAALPDAVAAVFQLHSDTCRAVHWDSPAAPPVLRHDRLLSILGGLMLGAAVLLLHLTAEEAAAQLVPLAAAHCAALQSLLGAPEKVQQLAAEQHLLGVRTCQGLALALAACPQMATALLADLTNATLQV